MPPNHASIAHELARQGLVIAGDQKQLTLPVIFGDYPKLKLGCIDFSADSSHHR